MSTRKSASPSENNRTVFTQFHERLGRALLEHDLRLRILIQTAAESS
jgi:hypothetical protein